MDSICRQFVEYVVKEAPKHNKESVEESVAEAFALKKDRKVYRNKHFAVRFNYSKSSSESFGNTVLALSALKKYDSVPFFVVLVRKEADNLIWLANSTFLKKISHSSRNLTMTNIRGSFNGSDIIRDYNGMSNSPDNFEELFAIHQGLDWHDNLERLVEATSNIKPKSRKFVPTEAEQANIFQSIDRADDFIRSAHFSELEKDLNDRCFACRNEILKASRIGNTNIRGRLIESLITSDEKEREKIVAELRNMEEGLPLYETENKLGDYCTSYDNADAYTDIKTTVVYLNSNPKAYNVDKFLKQMSDTRSVFFFFFVGVDETSVFKTLLCSVYHSKLVDNTLFQFHWAGRSTRGVAQFRGAAIDEMLEEENFVNDIDKEKCKKFIIGLLQR